MYCVAGHGVCSLHGCSPVQSGDHRPARSKCSCQTQLSANTNFYKIFPGGNKEEKHHMNFLILFSIGALGAERNLTE